MLIRAVAFFGFLLAITPCFSLKPIPQQEFLGSMSLEWKDVSYSVLVGQGRNSQKKHILHQLSGKAEPGHLVAIMGPTGRYLSQF
jgi:ABC-type multidrug transport system fused ATPase/permease subunit